MPDIPDPAKNPSRAFKDAVYEQLSRIGKAVSSPRRLELLDLLCQGPRTVNALATASGLSVANTSRHLQVLRLARLVATTKLGSQVEYRLADSQVCDFYLSLRSLGESRLAELEQMIRAFLDEKDLLEAVDCRDLIERSRNGEVTLLDVRPAEEYRAGHLPGAISVPLSELPDRLGELSEDREVVAYCRGPYCVLAPEAVKILRAHGMRARRLAVGVPEWRAEGLPVAQGERR